MSSFKKNNFLDLEWVDHLLEELKFPFIHVILDFKLNLFTNPLAEFWLYLPKRTIFMVIDNYKAQARLCPMTRNYQFFYPDSLPVVFHFSDELPKLNSFFDRCGENMSRSEVYATLGILF